MLKESLIEGIKNTFVFKGEMNRQQFWCYWLVMLIAIYTSASSTNKLINN